MQINENQKKKCMKEEEEETREIHFIAVCWENRYQMMANTARSVLCCLKYTEPKYLFFINYKSNLGFDLRRIHPHTIPTVSSWIICFDLRVIPMNSESDCVCVCASWQIEWPNEDVILWVFIIHAIGQRLSPTASSKQLQHVPSNTLN